MCGPSSIFPRGSAEVRGTGIRMLGEAGVGIPEWGQPSVPMSSGCSPEGIALFLPRASRKGALKEVGTAARGTSTCREPISSWF